VGLILGQIPHYIVSFAAVFWDVTQKTPAKETTHYTELNASQMPGDCPGAGLGGFGIDWYITLATFVVMTLVRDDHDAKS